ncbi:FAD binding protein [Nitzschia inconspicua]|uniref:FAD binding protein n=1 Tax=Nitzschia inconspicua TaxID=303405 RepID=A0A9K3M3D1_9STRA|nr:FAD binding protein [Nitzschia inconspicua]
MLIASDVNVWNDECVGIFREVATVPGVDGASAVVSNYLLLNQSSGLCLDHVGCAFENCKWPPSKNTWPSFPSTTSPFVIFDDKTDLTEQDLSTLSIPAMVLQPNHASDIVQAIQFCQQNDIGVTVKVAGHSYFGASSANRTLLIKMNPNYPKYAIGGSLTECSTVTPASSSEIPSANQMACALASARGKNAVLRVGGGELFDEAYRAVSFGWNAQSENLYHFVGGGAGTVSAAGGWLASGGLSGTTGMRIPLERDENLWEWTVCNATTVDFKDLWFAARGGGGGSYGVVTSVHYQVHNYPGSLTLVAPDLSSYPENAAETITPEAAYFFTTKYIEFFLRYMYSPESLNVTQENSRACNSAQTFNLSPFADGILFCYGTSGQNIVDKWQEYIGDPAVVEEMRLQSIPEDFIGALPLLLIQAKVVENYAQITLEIGAENPGVPEGRLADSPLADLVPVLAAFQACLNQPILTFPWMPLLRILLVCHNFWPRIFYRAVAVPFMQWEVLFHLPTMERMLYRRRVEMQHSLWAFQMKISETNIIPSSMEALI